MDLNLKGRLKLNVFKHVDGNKILIDSFEDDNLIVLSGKQLLTFLLAGESGSHRITKVGVGENPSSPYWSDTGLTNAFIKNVSGYTLLEPTVVQWNFSILPGDANGLTISEFGLFSTGGQLFARKVRLPVIPKDDSVSLDGDWTIWLVECKKMNFASMPTIAWDLTCDPSHTAAKIQTNISSTINTERQFTSTSNISYSSSTSRMFLYDQFVGSVIAEPGSDTFESVDGGDDMFDNI